MRKLKNNIPNKQDQDEVYVDPKYAKFIRASSIVVNIPGYIKRKVSKFDYYWYKDYVFKFDLSIIYCMSRE